MPVFTSEKHNLTGLNSYKYSGLANKKAVGLSVVKTGAKDHVVLSTKQLKSSGLQKPKKAILSTDVKKNGKRGKAQLNVRLCKDAYRRDLVATAQAKLSKVLKSLKKSKKQERPKRIAEKIAAKAEKEE